MPSRTIITPKVLRRAKRHNAAASKQVIGDASGKLAIARSTAAAGIERVAAAAVKASTRAMRKITFGDVTIHAPPPDQARLSLHLELSAKAMEAAMRAIQTPGIRMRRRKNIPLYYADDKFPGKMVRELNGKREVGVIKGSTFIVTE